MVFVRFTTTVALLIAAVTVNAAPFLGKIIEREDQLLDEYSYVIVGAGTAGLAVANRLSEDPAVNVLVLEAGTKDHKECAAILQRCLGDTFNTIYDWNISTIPMEALTGTNKVQHLPIGHALGGSSLLNGMMFDRPSPADISAWAELGNDGWDWESLLPYYKKSEHFSPPSAEQIEEFGITWDPEVHGDTGYLASSYPHFIYPQNKNFQDAMISLGFNQSKDQAGSALGVFWSPNSITPKNQTRSYSRSQYLEPFERRPNLHAIVHRQVTKLLTLKNSTQVTITGVQYVNTANKEVTLTVKASKEYILSAGTIHDPQILQLSGIGPKPLLEAYNIPVVIDLPGVGNGYQDHPFTTIAYNLSNVEHSPIDLDLNATWNAEQEFLYYKNRTGAWTAGAPNSVAFLPLSDFSNHSQTYLDAYTAQDTAEYLRPGLDDTVITGYAEQRKVLLKNLATKSMAAMEFIWLSGANRVYQMPFSFSIMHPFSRGYVEINTTDPFSAPVVDFRTVTNPVDLELFPDAYRLGRQAVGTPAIQELGPGEFRPGLNVNTDEQLMEFAKSDLTTMFHPTGTSSMQPLEHGGVVSPELKIYGTTNLRIVDASIMPLIIASHLQTTVYAIAEKASDMIKAAQ